MLRDRTFSCLHLSVHVLRQDDLLLPTPHIKWWKWEWSPAWRHSKVEDWSGRQLAPCSPVNFGQFYHRIINRRIFLSISLPKQHSDPFSPRFREIIIVFMAIFMATFSPSWFPLITIGFQINPVWSKEKKYFCVLTLSSNTYKRKKEVSCSFPRSVSV